MQLTRLHRWAAILSAPILVLPLAALPAQASPDNSKVVINEVYVDGSPTKGHYRDYVELYNPTDSEVNLSSYVLQYYSSKHKGNKSNRTTLTGTIPAHGYYLVTAKKGNPENELNADQQDGKFSLSSAGASIALLEAGSVPDTLTADYTGAIDLVGWGSKGIGEGTSISGTAKGSKSFQRNQPGVDTDDNSADFSVLDATPKSSHDDVVTQPPADGGTDGGTDGGDSAATPPGDGEEAPTPGGGEETPAPSEPASHVVTIAQVQGEGAETPFEKQLVTTKGVITAVYPYGGFQGFYMQTPGTGGSSTDATPNASDGVFVYVGSFGKLKNKEGQKPKTLEIGDYVEVTGTASERYGLTQISVYGDDNASVSDLPKDDSVSEPQPVELQRIPDGPVEREKLEGMLVKVTGDYTVAANYLTNRHGRLDLAPGDKPFRIPSDEIRDDTKNHEKWAELQAKIERERIALDDGASIDYTENNKKYGDNYDYPVPYLDFNNPLRVGTVVHLPKAMILDYRSNRTFGKNYEERWNLQPTKPLSNKKDLANTEWTKWVEFTSKRPAAPQFNKGNLTLTSFNVLNYFPTLGENSPGCSPNKDHDGIGITNSGEKCEPRGAYSQKAFEMQQSKIVAAINELNSSIVGLEEIENSVKFGENRDAALQTLVTALNAAAGSDKWAFVPSPAADKLPDLEAQDVIRTAFIYQKAHVAPVGVSKVLYDGVNWEFARQPLAQKFQAVKDGAGVGKQFVVVLNHLKSKGSDKDKLHPNDGYQGNNNHLRTLQVDEMSDWAAKNFADDPIFIIGDLNSYTHEDPLVKLESKGYTSIAETMGVTNHSFQYGGVVGSLDHALGNAEAMKMVRDADVWNVNAMEPVAFEYARWNSNINYQKLFDGSSPYRSSDHDPIKVAIQTVDETAPTEVALVAPTASEPTCEVKPSVELTPVDGVTYAVTVDGAAITPLADNANKYEYPYGKTVEVHATANDGYAFADGAKDAWTFTAKSREELQCSTSESDPVKPADPADPAQPEKPADPANPTNPGTPGSSDVNTGPVYPNSVAIEKAISEGKVKLAEELAVTQGNNIKVHFTGLTANTLADVYLYSEPIKLGEVMALADGTAVFELNTSNKIAAGVHYAVAVSKTAEAYRARSVVKVTILPVKGSLQKPQQQKPQQQQPQQQQNLQNLQNLQQQQQPQFRNLQSKKPVVTSRQGSGTNLANTGSSVLGLGLIAMLLIGAGAGVWSIRRWKM